MYIPPSEFDSREWVADYTPSPTQTPGFEFLFAIIGVLAGVYLVRQRGQV
jgi:PGF-CTERM protein